MSRHNFLIQRHCGGPNEGNPMAGCAQWLDGGIWNLEYHRDEYGNVGIATIEKAREAIAEARLRYPQNAYRIIQIVS